MVDQNGVNRARKQLPLLQKITELSFEERRDAVLSRECPEELRLEVVKEFVEREERLPRSGKGAVLEDVAAGYVKSALERSHKSEASGPQLHPDEVKAWDVIFQGYDVEWLADQTFTDAKDFKSHNFHLRPQKHSWIRRKRGSLSEEEERTKLEDSLAQKLVTVRRAKVGDVWDYFNQANKERFLLRRQLSSEAIAQWEKEFGDHWQWFCGREAEAYIPGERVEGNRFEWRREPMLCKTLGCYLCGEQFDNKAQLEKHWRERHIRLAKDAGPSSNGTLRDDTSSVLLSEGDPKPPQSSPGAPRDLFRGRNSQLISASSITTSENRRFVPTSRSSLCDCRNPKMAHTSSGIFRASAWHPARRRDRLSQSSI